MRKPEKHCSLPAGPVLAFMTLSIAFGSWAAASKPKRTPTAERLFETYSKPVPGVNWDELAPHYIQMLDRMFERNGWNDEADQYARKVASRIAALPPWDIVGRFSALTEEVSQRYSLTPEQTAALQRAIMREAAGFLLKHGPHLVEEATDALQNRTQGNPYTAEQIARWAQNAEPLFQDMKDSVDRVVGEFKSELSPEKKEVLLRDLAAFQKRQEAVEQMTRRWAQGEWRPEEWGLENDPVQRGRSVPPKKKEESAVKDANSKAASPAAIPVVAPAVTGPPLPDHYVDHDPATWIALVIEVRKQYGLDPGQTDTAMSIHDELVERADRYKKLRGADLESIPVSQRGTHEAYMPVRDLFGELRDRLASIPTSAQREARK